MGSGVLARCTFSAPGTYTFDCTVHGEAMKGQVTVGPEGTTTTTTTTSGTSTTPPPSVPGSSGGSAQPLLGGTASSALRLASTQLSSLSAGSVSLSRRLTVHG